MTEFLTFIFSDFWRWLGFTITVAVSLAAFKPVVIAEAYETYSAWK